MEFAELVQKRFSCKKYDGRPVEKKVMDEILKAAQVAPTAKNLQEQKIYLVQSEEGLKKIDRCTPCRYGASTVAVVAYDCKNVFVYPGGNMDSGAEDVTIVATHMLLAAANYGIDSCWINRFDPAEVAKELGLPENEKVVLLMDLGYAAEGAGPLENHFSRKKIEQTVFYM